MGSAVLEPIIGKAPSTVQGQSPWSWLRGRGIASLKLKV